MVRRRTHAHDREDREAGNGPQAPEPAAEAAGDGHNGAAGQTAVQPAEGTSPTMQRAEELVDRMADKVGHYAGMLGHKLRWLAARAREEAEDIWAEAQAVRRGEHR
jgi:hypothetical protein